jgi:inorganic pyrophosphatase
MKKPAKRSGARPPSPRRFRAEGRPARRGRVPFRFRFHPSTLGEDGDPLDVLILMDSPAFAGCIVPSRLIGAIQAEQTEEGKTERNDRLLADAAHSMTHQSLRELSDVKKDLIGQIEHFSFRTTRLRGNGSYRRSGWKVMGPARSCARE